MVVFLGDEYVQYMLAGTMVGAQQAFVLLLALTLLLSFCAYKAVLPKKAEAL